MPLNYFYPPPEQSSYTYVPQRTRSPPPTREEIQRKEEERKRAIEEKEMKEKKTKRENLYNSVIDKYIKIEYVKKHYEINWKSQETFHCIQGTITILQILGIAVIYFNHNTFLTVFIDELSGAYNCSVPMDPTDATTCIPDPGGIYSIFIILGIFCLDAFEWYQVKKRNINRSSCYNTISYSSSRIKAEKYYGKLEDMNENEFNKQLDILVNPYKIANQIIDRSIVQYSVYKIFRQRFYVLSLLLLNVWGVIMNFLCDKTRLPKEHSTSMDYIYANSEIALKFTMFIAGSLFIVLRLFVQHIVINYYYNPKIDLSPLFVREPSERQRLLTSTEV
jgi:hypothetical protein